MPPAFALSQDQTLRFILSPMPRSTEETDEQDPKLSISVWLAVRPTGPHKRSVTHSKENYVQQRSSKSQTIDLKHQAPSPIPASMARPSPPLAQWQSAANVSLPSLFNCQRTSGFLPPR